MPKPSHLPVPQARPSKRPVTIPFSEAFWDYVTEHFGLTKCQRSTVQLLLAGLPDKLIAAQRHCGIDNVKKHLGSAARKMGVHGRLHVFGEIQKLYAERWRDLGGAVLPEYSI